MFKVNLKLNEKKNIIDLNFLTNHAIFRIWIMKKFNLPFPRAYVLGVKCESLAHTHTHRRYTFSNTEEA